MIEIIEVQAAREIREFIALPLRMYRGCSQFSPMLYAEEKRLLRAPRESDAYETVFYLAKRDGKTVGRIQGILPKHADGTGQRSARLTRFDAVDDTLVSRALFGAVEKWAKARGATRLRGPWGNTDMDRAGILVEGFGETSVSGETYNFSYYAALFEDYGFEKEADLLSFELTAPEKKNEMLARVARRSLELSHLHVASTQLSKREYIEKYAESFFETFEACFGDRYGAPLTVREKKEQLLRIAPFLNVKYTILLCDERERVVGFGLALPRLAQALKRSNGRLTLRALPRLRRIVKKPRELDLILMGVRPEYRNAGINAVIVQGAIDMLTSGGAEKLEISMNLETDTRLMAQWKYLTVRQHKRRRAYVKEIR